MHAHKLVTLAMVSLSLMMAILCQSVPLLVFSLENEVRKFITQLLIYFFLSLGLLKLMEYIFFKYYFHPIQEAEDGSIYLITKIINLIPSKAKKQAQARKLKYTYQFLGVEVDSFGDKENSETRYILYTNEKIQLKTKTTYICHENEEGFQMEEFICKNYKNKLLKEISVN